MAMSIRREAEQLVGIELSATMLWNHPTIASLAGYLAKKLLPQNDPERDIDVRSDPASSVLDALFDSVESAPPEVRAGSDAKAFRLEFRRMTRPHSEGCLGWFPAVWPVLMLIYSGLSLGATGPESNGKVLVMPVVESSIPAVLEDRAVQRSDDIAFTFIDYEVNPAAV